MKLTIYISMACVGTWGLLSAALPDYVKEIFLGMVIPWSISLISIVKTRSVYNSEPGKTYKTYDYSYVDKDDVLWSLVDYNFHFYIF